MLKRLLARITMVIMPVTLLAFCLVLSSPVYARSHRSSASSRIETCTACQRIANRVSRLLDRFQATRDDLNQKRQRLEDLQRQWGSLRRVNRRLATLRTQLGHARVEYRIAFREYRKVSSNANRDNMWNFRRQKQAIESQIEALEGVSSELGSLPATIRRLGEELATLRTQIRAERGTLRDCEAAHCQGLKRRRHVKRTTCSKDDGFYVGASVVNSSATGSYTNTNTNTRVDNSQNNMGVMLQLGYAMMLHHMFHLALGLSYVLNSQDSISGANLGSGQITRAMLTHQMMFGAMPGVYLNPYALVYLNLAVARANLKVRGTQDDLNFTRTLYGFGIGPGFNILLTHCLIAQIAYTHIFYGSFHRDFDNQRHLMRFHQNMFVIGLIYHFASLRLFG